MLRHFQTGLGSWIAKAFILLLIVSFGFWGMDGYSQGGANQAVASIGGVHISPQEFDLEFRKKINQLSKSLKTQISREAAIKYGVPQTTLEDLLGKKAIALHASELGLGVNDQLVADTIQNDKSFKDKDNKFSADVYKYVLRNNGLTASQHERDVKENLILRQIASALNQSSAVPKTMVNTINAYRQNRRSVDYFKVPKEAVPMPGVPADDVLKAAYQKDLTKYQTPEFRMLDIIDLSPSTIAASLTVKEEDVKKDYKAQKEQYITPEQRKLVQLTFKTMDKAKEAHARLLKKESFADVAKSLGLTDNDTNLGTVARSAMLDSKIGDAAFALKKDGFSEPIEGKFAITIVQVQEIKPRVEKTLKDVRGDIEERLKLRAANQKITDLYEAIEDERGAGSRLSEVATKLSLKLTKIEAVDRAGAGKDKKPIKDLPAAGQLLAQAFSVTVGDDTAAIETKDRGYVFFEVVRIEPITQIPFEKVKDQVAKKWVDDKYREDMLALAAKYGTELENGTPFKDVAEKAKAKFATSKTFARGGVVKDIPSDIVRRAFVMAPNAASSVWEEESNRPVVFQIKEIKPADPLSEKKAIDYLTNELSAQFTTDNLDQYILALKKRFGTTIRADKIKQVINR